MQSCVLVSLLLSGVDAMRKHRVRVNDTDSPGPVHSADLYATGSRGQAANLLIWGAPKVSGEALENPMASDGCFPGYRFVAQNTRNFLVDTVDVVPAMLRSMGYTHPLMETAFLRQEEVSKRECGWRGVSVERGSADLHMRAVYVERTSAHMPEFEDHGRVALDVSHTHDPVEAAEFVARFGYRLVGSALERDEASHLIQNPATGDCMLTFEPSDRLSDWMENAQVMRRQWCGLQQWVHRGFVRATMEIVATPMFEEGVRPKLGHCRTVDVVGHSLGGAMAALFTACAHNTVEAGEPGYDDWKHFWWTKKETKIMDAIA